MDYPDKWAAIVWMCRNQLGRRNINDEQKTVLIGEAYKAQKMTQGSTQERSSEGRFLRKDQNGPFGRYENTAQRIADDFKVGEQTVKRAERFVDGLNEAEKVSPGIKESILSGEVKAPKSMISEIRNIPEEKRVNVVEAIKQGDTCAAKAIIRESKPAPEKKPDPEPEAFTPEELGELIDAALTFPGALGIFLAEK